MEASTVVLKRGPLVSPCKGNESTEDDTSSCSSSKATAKVSNVSPERKLQIAAMAARLDESAKVFNGYHKALQVKKRYVPALKKHFHELDAILHEPESEEKNDDLQLLYEQVEENLKKHARKEVELSNNLPVEPGPAREEAIRDQQKVWNARISKYMTKFKDLTVEDFDNQFIDNHLNYEPVPIRELETNRGSPVMESLRTSNGPSFLPSLLNFLNSDDWHHCLKDDVNIDEFKACLAILPSMTPPHACRDCDELLDAFNNKKIKWKLRQNFKRFTLHRFRSALKKWIATSQVPNRGQTTDLEEYSA